MKSALSDFSELKKRILTGFIGGSLVFFLLFWGGSIGVYSFTSLLVMGCLFEFNNMIFHLPDCFKKKIFLTFLALFCLGINYLAPNKEFYLISGSFLISAVYFLISAKQYQGSDLQLHFREWMYSIFGTVYCIFLPLFLVQIYEFGMQWLILFFLTVWGGDTLAYFIGKYYGRQKLYIQISPKKTYEGALGNLVGSILIILLLKALWFKEQSWIKFIGIGVLVNLTAQIGDLCESFLKRCFAKKDSGNIFPGHGGFLDRFDSIILSSPMMYFLIQFLSEERLN